MEDLGFLLRKVKRSSQSDIAGPSLLLWIQPRLFLPTNLPPGVFNDEEEEMTDVKR